PRNFSTPFWDTWAITTSPDRPPHLPRLKTPFPYPLHLHENPCSRRLCPAFYRGLRHRPGRDEGIQGRSASGLGQRSRGIRPHLKGGQGLRELSLRGKLCL